MSEQPQTARSYRGAVVDDNAIVSINLKWLGQLLVLVGMLVYGYWRIESRLGQLEDKMVTSDVKIEDLLEKHMVEEKLQRERLEEKVSFMKRNLTSTHFHGVNGRRNKCAIYATFGVNNGRFSSHVCRIWDDWCGRLYVRVHGVSECQTS